MVTQSVQILHQIGSDILLAHKDHELLRSIVEFYATIIGTLEKKSAASLAAELKLPELPFDELMASRKLKIMNGKSKKESKVEEESFDYWQQEQELVALKTKDINSELRKLIALNFPALFHVLCTGLTPQPNADGEGAKQENGSDSSSNDDEIHSAVGLPKLRKVSLSRSSGEEEHKSP